jgi:Cys-tRNA(Pro)/Cys-tRNA(Cys) deacylase
MTPAIRALESAQIPFTLHPYEHTGEADSYGLEAAAALGVDPDQVFKTLVVRTEAGDLLLALVPVSGKLDLKELARVLGERKVELADPAMAERTTGYVVGGISPVGGRKSLPTLIDETVVLYDRVYVSAGRRGLQMSLAPADLIRITRASTAMISASP